MALSLSNLVRKKSDKPPRIVIYGRGKMGKTTLASEFPEPIFIQTEEGEGEIEVTTFKNEPLASFAEVNEALVALASEDHEFKTLVLDSVTQLEPLIWTEACLRNGWNSIEDPGFGKGYIEADAIWMEFLSACNWLRDNKSMTIILIGHERVEKFSDPERDDYTRYRIRLQQRSSGAGAEPLIREWADVVGFLSMEVTLDKQKSGFGKETVKAKGSGQRALNLSPRPTFEAGSRYEVPPKILINPGQGYAALAPYLPGQPGKPAAAAA
jgi:hypothetical protein